ncbi:hypothetical protein LOK49_LG08G00606 [Camellia lanceoleosa]|uniref:Uncharacterized protein n=1 Tax=Camellia lanceoleosa TaxID=1840588 RepID=A0ACC0GW82_9ERIC|nr:hypothetical protein LOK49_LG08G00606 [Camellia lanceoleosa]
MPGGSMSQLFNRKTHDLPLEPSFVTYLRIPVKSVFLFLLLRKSSVDRSLAGRSLAVQSIYRSLSRSLDKGI